MALVFIWYRINPSWTGRTLIFDPFLVLSGAYPIWDVGYRNVEMLMNSIHPFAI